MRASERFREMSRVEAAVLGGLLGYAVGLLGGPLLRAGLTVVVMIGFYFLFKHIDTHLETNWGLAGVIFAVFFCNIVGSVEGFVGGLLGDIVADASRLGLAIVGAAGALRLQQSLDESDDLDEFQ